MVHFHDLWDVQDPAFLDKVACDCLIKVIAIDPKNSRFEMRMKCKWSFRSGHRYEKTETKLRVPGIRLPGLIVTVDESRIWKDLDKTRTSKHTVLWRGISRFTISGFERFEMHDFPFDRQVVSLDTFDFVWCSDAESGEFDFSMQLVSLHVKCVSLLPEWEPFSPIVSAIHPQRPTEVRREHGDAPYFASRFTVKLRLERANWYYIVQVFGLTVMITIASVLGVTIPLVDNLSDRLSLYAGGILTLTSFKYSVSDQLPSVPYSTNFDWAILFQFTTLILCALETLVCFRLVQGGLFEEPELRPYEDIFFVVLFVVWMIYWFWIAGKDLGLPCGLVPHDWLYILSTQEFQADGDELENFGVKRDKGKIGAINDQLADIFQEINATREKIANAPEMHASPEQVKKYTDELIHHQKRRTKLEEELFRLVNGREDQDGSHPTTPKSHGHGAHPHFASPQ